MHIPETGSICWAAFLDMGARHENSPTTSSCILWLI